MGTEESTNVPEPAPAPAEGAPEGHPANSFPVVGVGASAGGLEAFRELIENLPPNPGLAVLYAQHLDPNARSFLPEILGGICRMPVREAREGMPVLVDHLYLIPPNMSMALVDGSLTLSPRPHGRAPHMPIDHLFRSLAEIQKSRAIGVILSGGGTDGTLGFEAIKAEGGITFAQDEKSARQDSMPRSAAAGGYVDYVLPPAEIARHLLRITRHPYASEPEPAAVPLGDQEVLADIMGLLRSHAGLDFSLYKQTTILRRIRRRMALRGLDTLSEYLRELERDPTEVHSLYQDFLIRVTRFFRDPEVFEALKATVFPNLVKGRSPNVPLRVWVAGCSTGEEVYSLAIALLEFLGDRVSSLPIKILASDVNEAALERARLGLYIDNIEVDVSPERLRRFFAKVDGRYQITKVVRDLCVFSRHNLANDPPFSRLDLVTCRNVLIYLNAPLQRRILSVLHYSLNPGGYLVLGSSETVGPFGDLFTTVDGKHRIYSKSFSTRTAPGLDLAGYSETGLLGIRWGEPRPSAATWTALDVQKEADRVILSRYAPAGVVIDENGTVLQFRGRTGPYLEPAPGMASLDLMKMLREGLLIEVRTALGRARMENAPVRREGIPLQEANRLRLVHIEVLPFKVPPTGVRCFLVLFEDAPPLSALPSASSAKTPPGEGAGAAFSDAGPSAAEQQVLQLQQELAATREYLQSLIEEHESATEELKSASEELLSANEELQSTNEELQTAKEETQSANEELATVNDELRHRNLELAQANNDLVNSLAAVHFPIVLVSRDLRIRRFTPSAERVLNLIPTDVGRPISDIKPNINVADLGELTARVIDELVPVESQIQDREGHWYSLRVRPYVTLENKIEGASITLVDIDSIKEEG